MAPSPRRALVALIVVTLFVNVAVADDESFLAAMRNLIFGTQQQNQIASLFKVKWVYSLWSNGNHNHYHLNRNYLDFSIVS
uniref:Secreted protein n=1 Tax=Steinernema glaseri TaxID=37863 RepID=A0A1I8ADC7_9BILA